MRLSEGKFPPNFISSVWFPSSSWFSTSNLRFFLGISEAFHRLNQRNLFEDLARQGVPMYLVQVMYYWYANQPYAVKRGNTISTVLCISNGIRQGGLVSSSVYNNFADELNHRLPCSGWVRHSFVLCRAYGIISFFSEGLAIPCKYMYRVCRQTRHYTQCNHERHNEFLTNNCRKISPGHKIASDFRDELVMGKWVRKFNTLGNVMIRNFGQGEDDVKIKLFQTHCSLMYCTG